MNIDITCNKLKFGKTGVILVQINILSENQVEWQF